MQESHLCGAARARGWRKAAAARAVCLAVLTTASGYAAAQLPFTESFDNQTLRDAAGTTADWGVSQPGRLVLPSANALSNVFSAATPACIR